MAGKLLQLVDNQNGLIGYDTWQSCHGLQPKLHRGFTALVFNSKNELLIQQRSKQKPLWPGYWDGISSHPRKGESLVRAAEKRLQEEMGFTCRLKKTGQFVYKAKYNNLGYEWEDCAILEGKYDGKVKPDPNEVANFRWISWEKLKNEIAQKPDIFAPWFKIIIQKMKPYGKT